MNGVLSDSIIDVYNSDGVFKSLPSYIVADVSTIEGMSIFRDRLINSFKVCLKSLPVDVKLGIKSIELYYKDVFVHAYSCTLTNRGFLDCSGQVIGKKSIGVLLSNAITYLLPITNINTVDVKIGDIKSGIVKVSLKVSKLNKISLTKEHLDYLKSVVCSYVDEYKKSDMCLVSLSLNFVEKGVSYAPLGGCNVLTHILSSISFSSNGVDNKVYAKVVDLGIPVCKLEFNRSQGLDEFKKGKIVLDKVASFGREFYIKFTDI